MKIIRDPNGDTRTCDWSKVSWVELLSSSINHIGDVTKGMKFFTRLLMQVAKSHDFDKVKDIDRFHRDFATGFKQTAWWDKHRKENRHHLEVEDGVPDDVNLVDVIEYIVDSVVAGMARSGEVRSLEISSEVLQRALYNTVELLKRNVEVITLEKLPIIVDQKKDCRSKERKKEDG